jgi:tRNA G18 (ribose-2'-O)-methylase SpoU
MSTRFGRSPDPHPEAASNPAAASAAALDDRVERDRHEESAALRARPRFPMRVVLDNLRSAFNVGSIIRTSDAARVMHVHLCGITARPPHVQLARTALGASRFVPWSHHSDTLDVVRALKSEGVAITALETTASAASYLEADYRLPMALVLGHEVRGVDPLVLAECDHVVTIPMWGVKNSLNVATAFGIVTFEVRRRYAATTPPAARDCTS